MKHELTKKTEIPQSVKDEVWERDNRECIVCHISLPVNYANAHYIRRSQLGMGIKENIVTLCPACHHEFDNGKNGLMYKQYIKKYLDNLYPDFTDEQRKYDKWRWVK